MVGFGFMDNFVMIQAGQYIDSTLGVQLGLATMTAAAAGQVVSDVSGVVFGGTLERFLQRLGLIRSPCLTSAQRQLPITRNVTMAGAVLGVIVGCALGACTLCFVDLEARDRIHHATQLRDLVTDLVAGGSADEAALVCERATVHVKQTGSYDLAHMKMEPNALTSLVLLEDGSNGSAAARDCAAQREVIVDENGKALYAPVVKLNGDVMAVVELRKSDQMEAFRPADLHTAKVMGRHIAIFMDRIIES
jgi:hypothetical protein